MVSKKWPLFGAFFVFSLCFSLVCHTGEQVFAEESLVGSELGEDWDDWVLVPDDGSPERVFYVDYLQDGRSYFDLGGKRFIYNSQTKNYEDSEGSGEYYRFDKTKNPKRYMHHKANGVNEWGKLEEFIRPIGS